MSLKDKPLGSTDASDDHTKTTDVIAPCACNRDLTLNELMAAYPDRKKAIVEKFLPELNATMQKYGITSCIRKVHFLAQVGHESAELQYTAEVLKKGVLEKDVYDGYKGRGLIQLTWRVNYLTYGKAVDQNFLDDNKPKLEQVKWATDSAGWFWINKELNSLADKNDMLRIAFLINAGFNGYEGEKTARLSMLKRAADALQVRACTQLNAMFTAHPELEPFNYESYPLEKSVGYDDPRMAYAWGYWHDPNSKTKGTRKDAAQAKVGYARCIELMDAGKKIKGTMLYGKTLQAAHDFAKKRINDLS
jgi:putative chitinase